MEEKLIQTPEASVKDQLKKQHDEDQFSAFLAAVKEGMDKTFDQLGYVCFVFDKKSPSNPYVANFSNTTVDGFMSKLLPFLVKYKVGIRKAQKKLRKKLGRRP